MTALLTFWFSVALTLVLLGFIMTLISQSDSEQDVATRRVSYWLILIGVLAPISFTVFLCWAIVRFFMLFVRDISRTK